MELKTLEFDVNEGSKNKEGIKTRQTRLPI
jgi:hypothetical protein